MGLTVMYLSRRQIADMIGFEHRSLTPTNLPVPDAVIGPYKGWLPNTIAAWMTTRKGKGEVGTRRKEDDVPDNHHCAVYLSRTEVAARYGLRARSFSRVELPPPDAVIGTYLGWLPNTVDHWRAERPGRGFWGRRPLSMVK